MADRLTRKELDAWILARKAEGLWVTLCDGCCGGYFTQPRKGNTGARSKRCSSRVCLAYSTWRKRHGRAPAPWMIDRWRERWPDDTRTWGKKQHVEQRVIAEAG